VSLVLQLVTNILLMLRLGARNDSSNDSMVANGLDLNYVGVYDIWNNDLGLYFTCSRLIEKN
jgi:hypothetical protein